MSVQFHLDHYPLDVEVPPLGWLVTSVRALCGEPQPGFASGQHNRDGRGVVHLRPMNVDSHGSIALDEVKYVAADATLRVQHGDVLFNNTNSPAWVGKSAAILRPTDWAFSNHMTRLRPSTGVDARFLAAQLQYLQQSGYFRHLCVNHVNQASISSGVIGDAVPVLLAPEREQTRIADRIDELFTDLAAGVAALERVKRNLSRYRAAVLHAAVTGRLTEAWRKQNGSPDEPGPKLLERILAERRRQWEERTRAKYEKAGKQPPKNWRDRYPKPSPPKSDGREPLPAGWAWATVDQLTRGDRDSAYGVLVPGEEVADGVPLVRIGDIRNGSVDVEGLKRIAPSIAAKFKRTFLEGGELLMSLVGTIGRTAIAPPEVKGANTARAVGVIPLSFLVEARFVEYWFRNPTRVTEMTLKSHEVARKTLNLEDVRPTLVALPPLAEQSAIVEAVNEKLSQIDGLEAEIERGLARASRLRQSILKAAFEGKLVPQDPADEPASELLARIGRAEDAPVDEKPRRAAPAPAPPTPTRQRARKAEKR